MALQMITTADGSHSLLNTDLEETYHSVHGAVQESIHVFINNGLAFFAGSNDRRPVKIIEMGFGTGLNALLAADFAAHSGMAIEYCSIEAYPVNLELIGQLNYRSLFTSSHMQVSWEKLHSAPWNTPIQIAANFSFEKKLTTLQEVTLKDQYFDVVFFDAFAPSKQPELWELSIIKKITDALHSGGLFVTYCAKGQLKRDLKSLGLLVETLPGPPGKKEMVRATVPEK